MSQSTSEKEPQGISLRQMQEIASTDNMQPEEVETQQREVMRSNETALCFEKLLFRSNWKLHQRLITLKTREID
jgi:hypothetical protein